MSFSKSPLSFEDIRTALDRAMEAPKGILVRLETPGAAVSFVSRANYCRLQDRKENAKTYPDGHPLKQASIWDALRIRADGQVVRITKGDGSTLEIEEI